MYDIGNIQEIYKRLQDDESKSVYIDRLDYSLTNDAYFLRKLVDKTLRDSVIWKDFLGRLDELAIDYELVIFGAGIWGNILYRETCARLRWKCMIDSNPMNRNDKEISLVSFEKFVESYDGECIVISSYKNYREMAKQIKKCGIPDEKVIDAGSIIYQLTEKAAYFDLEELRPCKKQEVFVDAGCFDGCTTKRFFEWCGGKGYSYCLEPDGQNIDTIREKLAGYENYEIIDRAAWSKTTVLSMDAKGSFATSVAESGLQGRLKKVQATALDDILADKKVTFIKMDIEGAEVEALYGAKQIITKQKPRLAISVYHKPDDIWTIPRIIVNYNPDYKLYLRHYSFSDYDTVLYAIP